MTALTSLCARAKQYFQENSVRASLSLAAFYGPSLLYHRRLGMRPFNTSGVDIFEQDWDNLILLDACRYDIFNDIDKDFGGKMTSRISRASSTSEFIRANFADRELHDVVYVSANPWFMKLKDEIDASVYDYYDVHNEPQDQLCIDQMRKTTEQAAAAATEYPNKRLLVHYGPPHHPLFGSTADRHLPSIESQMEMGFYERIRRGEIDVSDSILREAYTETLDAVLTEVTKLLETLEGKTVIGADHGEMLGERAKPVPVKYYGHVPGLYTKELVTVPWHVCKFKTRRPIEEGEPVETHVDDSEVDQRLRDLGYKV